MIEDLSKYVDFLVKHGITADQFLLLYCLHLDKLEPEELGRKYREKGGVDRPIANLYKYHSVMKWSKEDIKTLVDKEFLKDMNKPGDSYPDNMEVTPLFVRQIFSGRGQFNEMWDMYPAYAKLDNGTPIPLRMVSEEDAYLLFVKMVGTVNEFSRLMRALEWAKDHDLIKMKITNFLSSRHWRDLEILMEETAQTDSRGSLA